MTQISINGLHQLSTNKKLIFMIGPGGVGKTTTSISVALAAAQKGARVALISIDPAKRLAGALGIELGFDLKKVQLQQKIKGELHALMIDQQTVFDGMVRKFARDKVTMEKIFANPLYQIVSTKLSGAIEYMSLAKLSEIIETDKFDLIVVDTPPDLHALRFFESPNVLESFMAKGVIEWLSRAGELFRGSGVGRFLLDRIMRMNRWFEGLTSITGVNAILGLADFLFLMKEVVEGLNFYGKRLQKLLIDKDTAFVLVMAPDLTHLRRSYVFYQQLQEYKCKLHAVIINKVLPQEVSRELSLWAAKEADAAMPAAGQTILSVDAVNALRQRFQGEALWQKSFCVKFDLSAREQGPLILKIPELAVDVTGEVALLQLIAGCHTWQFHQ